MLYFVYCIWFKQQSLVHLNMLNYTVPKSDATKLGQRAPESKKAEDVKRMC